VAPITVTRTRHGPFERIVLAATEGRKSNLSVYRVGDMLLDTGGTRVSAELVEALRADPPRRIVLTHQHEDHAGGVTALRRAFGQLTVHAPALHVERLRAFDRVPEYRAQAWGHPEPIPDAQGYHHGARFLAGGLALEAVETPGHTPGHMALVARVGQESWALTGDLYVTDRPLTAWYESAADDMVRSLRTLAARPGLRALPTHGAVLEDGGAAFQAVAELVEREAERVRAAAERLGTVGPAEVARALYGPEGSFAERSGGEFSYAAFVRSVLAPVRELPASVPALG
jgi:glyoxylase-like metal-dependent hydrolase (beta-lactamase superfamily II)